MPLAVPVRPGLPLAMPVAMPVARAMTRRRPDDPRGVRVPRAHTQLALCRRSTLRLGVRLDAKPSLGLSPGPASERASS